MKYSINKKFTKILEIGIIGIIKSIFWNIKLLPFQQAIKLPILVSSKTKIKGTKRGSIIFTSRIKPAILSFGLSHLDGSSISKNLVSIKGSLIIHGNNRHLFGPGTSLFINKDAILEIGDFFECGKSCKFIISSHSKIGNFNMHSWEILYLDYDGHPIFNSDNLQINEPKGFSIGDNVWIGARSSILKGINIANGIVIGTGSIVSKSVNEPNCIFAGGKIIKKNIRWQYNKNPYQWGSIISKKPFNG